MTTNGNSKHPLCGVIAESSIQEIKTIIATNKEISILKLIEIRLDYLKDFEKSTNELKKLIASNNDFFKFILTFPRKKFIGDDESYKKLIERLIKEIKPAFVDLDYSFISRNKSLFKSCEKNNITPIISSHFDVMPKFESLVDHYDALVTIFGHETFFIKKIIPTARSFKDNLIIWNFLDNKGKNNDLVTFCMGRKGRISRLTCTMLGSLFTYVMVSPNSMAPGMFYLSEFVDLYNKISLNEFTGDFHVE